MYPMVFSSVFKEKVWGGRALKEVLSKDLPTNKLYGESWEVSAHPNGLGIVQNGEYKGKTLPEILDEHGKEIMGEKIYKKYQGKFPLLLKFLDINDKLSIQVHPSNDYAIPNENSFGKAECWYILDASDDAELIMGMKPGITPEKYYKKAIKNDFDDLFKTVTVRKGDLVVIKPGMVHASLIGSVLICELQQNSDVTYRIYDFDREENGQKRELHLEQSRDVIDYEAKADVRSYAHKKDSELCLLDWEYFTLNRIILNGTSERKAIDTMKIYSVLEGELLLVSQDTKITLKEGQAFLLPANQMLTLEGNAILLESYPK